MIRSASDRDIPRIMELLEQVNEIHHMGRPDLFQKTTKYSAEELKAIFSDSLTPVFVWTNEKDETCGYAFCKTIFVNGDRMLTDVKTLYIDDLCVDENMRGKHIGTSLFEYVKAFAKENGFHNLTLNVWALNPDAVRFYEVIGMQVQKYGMELIL